MRTRIAAAALTAAALLGLAACSSSSNDSGGKAYKPLAGATTTPPAAPTTTAPATAPAPDYRVYRNSGGGSADIGIADLLLPGATATTARAAIQDFIHKKSSSGSVAYIVHVVPTTAANGQFVCEGDWRKDAAAVTSFGGTQGLTISCH